MELLYIVGMIWSLLLIALAVNFDDRRPMSTKLKYQYRVKDDSIFRKIIKFKDGKHSPCNYFKIVPIYVLLLFAILGLITLLVDLFTKGFFTDLISKKASIVVIVVFVVIVLLYYTSIFVWWEIVDHREFKFTQEEKLELKRFKNPTRKENAKNSSISLLKIRRTGFM